MDVLVYLALIPLVSGNAGATAETSGGGGIAGEDTSELQNDGGITLAGILDTSNFDWAETIFSVTIDLLNSDYQPPFQPTLQDNGFFDEEMSSINGPISYRLFDAACDGFTAMSAYWDARPVDGVIGARCSSASKSLAWMGAIDNTPQISMTSTSAKLSDKAEFPYFSRMVSPDDERGQVGALVATMRLFDWDRVTIINTDTVYAKDMATAFRGLWKGKVPYLGTVELASDGSVDEASLVKVLEEAPLDDPVNNSKVVVLIAHDQHAFRILEVATNYFPAETFWVGTQAWADRAPPSTGWTPEIPGYLGLRPFRNRDGAYQQFLRLGAGRLDPVLDEGGNLPDYGAEHAVDAIVAMALALAATPAGSRTDGARVTEELRKLEFAGVSGPVAFTEQGDRRDPQFSIVNYQRFDDGYRWVDVGKTGIEVGSARFGPKGIRGVCFAGVGCGLSSAPDDSPPVPPDRIAAWVPTVLVLLCFGFLVSFWLYRRKKIASSRKTKAILVAKEAELDDFRNSVVGMCTAEAQYVPKLADAGASGDAETGADRARWCWRETAGYMDQWDDEMIEGDRSGRWIKYDESSNEVLELAHQEQGQAGRCAPNAGYVVDFGAMVQTKDATGFQREVARVKCEAREEALDLSVIRVGEGCPEEITKEPQMVLVPGDIVQVSKKRDDGWAYGSKLHQNDEPLGRRLVQLTLAGQDRLDDHGDVDGDDGKIIITDKHGWFPIDVTRVPNTDDLAILRNTLGEADGLAAPDNWDEIVDPSVVQKSDPLDDTSKEYREVVDSFTSTQADNIQIVSVQRIQNMAMWQSYLVKRKTVVDRDKSLCGASSAKQSLSRFERRWLWHGTNADSVEKIIQQGFNRSFCGKNATMYGKGVYFARDTSYSSCDTYSPTDSKGNKYILACRVVVGEYCLGKQDAPTPDLRDAAKNILYDSTVNSLANTILYVTYHDAQAYPEYLIRFKEKRKSKRH